MPLSEHTKLAAAAAFYTWVHSTAPTSVFGQKHADYAPPAVGEEADALTGQFKAPLADVLSAIQEMIGTELKTAYAYHAYAQSVRGPYREALVKEFEEHADRETEHAEYLMARASVLGGALQLPDIPAPPGSSDPVDIITRMVRMEQEGLAQWRLLHSMIGEDNPMRIKVEEYMSDEEEHSDDLARMLPEGTLPTPLETASTPTPALGAPAGQEPAPKLAELMDEDTKYLLRTGGNLGAITGGGTGALLGAAAGGLTKGTKGALLGALLGGGAGAGVGKMSGSVAGIGAPHMLQRRIQEVPLLKEANELMPPQELPGAQLDTSPADAILQQELEGAQAEEEASSAYFQQRLQEQQAEAEQLKAQLEQVTQQAQQTQEQLGQQQQLVQQQQQALQQTSDTASRALAQQIQQMQLANQMREQTTNTIASHDQWKNNVTQMAQQLLQTAAAPPVDTNVPPEQAMPEEGQEQPPPEEAPPEEQAGPPKTASLKEFGQAAGRTFMEGAREHLGPTLKQLGSAKGALGAAALTGIGGVHGYFRAKDPGEVEEAQSRLQRAETAHQDKGSFLTALNLAKAKATMAHTEAEHQHPVLGALRGAGQGAFAGLSLAGAVNELSKWKNNGAQK